MTQSKLNRDQALKIRAVGELLADPRRRCIDAYARDANGVSVDLKDPRACSWCLSGATEKVHGWEYGSPGGYAYMLVAQYLRGEGPAVEVLPYYWEGTDDAGREVLVQKLLNVEVPS